MFYNIENCAYRCGDKNVGTTLAESLDGLHALRLRPTPVDADRTEVALLKAVQESVHAVRLVLCVAEDEQTVLRRRV